MQFYFKIIMYVTWNFFFLSGTVNVSCPVSIKSIFRVLWGQYLYVKFLIWIPMYSKILKMKIICSKIKNLSLFLGHFNLNFRLIVKNISGIRGSASNQ